MKTRISAFHFITCICVFACVMFPVIRDYYINDKTQNNPDIVLYKCMNNQKENSHIFL